MRNKLKVTIDAEGRDKGKVFIIHEMAAEPLEDWAVRAFMGLQSSGVDMPKDVISNGIAGIARLGITALAGMKYDDLKPLLREMMACVHMIPDPSRPDVSIAMSDFPDQIEELATRMKLRTEWFRLHVGFSTPGDL